MTKEEFMKSTLKLQEMYKKELNGTQLEFWFNELQKFEHIKYQRAIGEYVKKSKSMPTISEILKEINNLRPLGDENVQVVKPTPCDTCHRFRTC